MPTFRTSITATFHCSLECAFQTPMLGDITRVHTGYLFMPKVTHTTDHDTWGQVGGSRRVFMAPNLFFKGGEAALDTVLERIENQYWKIEISQFKYQAMGFSRFQGEWSTQPNPDDTVAVTYTYTLFSELVYLYPLQWLFTKIAWRMYMRHALECVRKLADETCN